MTFVVSAIDQTGWLRAITVEAVTQDDARSTAEASGLSVLTVRESRTSKQKPFSSRPAGFVPRRFAEDLAALLEAGLSLTESISTIGARDPQASRRSIYEPILRSLAEGKPLSAALQANGGTFPTLLIATVKASEQTGDLAQSLARYAVAQARLEAVRQRIVSASIYPAILLAVGAAVVVFLLGFVVPRFAALIDTSSADIPQASRLLMQWGKLVNAHMTAICAALLAAVAAALVTLSRPSLRAIGVRNLARLPGLGAYVRTYGQNQFWQTSAMLIQGGIAAPQAFRTAAHLLADVDRQCIAETLARLERGQDLAQAFSATGLVDAVGARMLQVAQRTGQLGRALQHLAAFQGEGFERSLDRLTKLAEPLLMVIIGIVIGTVVVLMYMPIFDLASSIQ